MENGKQKRNGIEQIRSICGGEKMIQLYQYQEELITGLREAIQEGHRKIILTAPTSAGKTVIFSSMA